MSEKPYAIIVEDDPKLSTVFQMTLQQAGYDTALDLNGDKYRSLLDSAEPALVILDLHLPYAFGGDILDDIRARYPRTVIAVVTADIVKAKNLTEKADHILMKPVSVTTLLQLAESVKRTL
ncbi:MAG: response regulator [Anaerolineales bacterium]|nr:response regulator [Anaerolineales bacterium]